MGGGISSTSLGSYTRATRSARYSSGTGLRAPREVLHCFDLDLLATRVRGDRAIEEIRGSRPLACACASAARRLRERHSPPQPNRSWLVDINLPLDLTFPDTGR